MKSLQEVVPGWGAGALLAAVVLLVSWPAAAQQPTTSPDVIGPRSVTLSQEVVSKLPPEIVEFLTGPSIEFLGWTRDGSLVASGKTSHFRGRYILAGDGQGFRLLELQNTPYLSLKNTVENVSLFGRSRNAAGRFFVDIGFLVTYVVPSWFSSREGRETLDEGGRRMLILEINLKHDRIGTPFELGPEDHPRAREMTAAARDAVLAPLRLVAVGGAIAWAASCLSRAE